MIEESKQIQEEPFSSNFKVDNKDKNLEPSFVSNTFSALITTLLNKIISTGTNFDHSVEQLCDPYIESKYTKIVKHKKMTSTTRKLKEIYADLWRPYNPSLLLGKTYIGLFLNEFTRKSWVLLLQSKDEFFNIFKFWLPRAEVYGEKLGYLQTDDRGKFISATLKNFCKERSLTIGYAAPYMHKENGIVERYWRTLATIKDSLFIDSSLPVNFWAEAMDIVNYLCNKLPTRRVGPAFIPKEA